ncbi:MAG: heterodisulfide reductase-related iron-sulfur binding cluster, partial [Euryarchaeota archaeon]|nr:heterodisulfide reductase-related iron-sulfur binding cluster [Euryarchaeota archaeon]
FLIESTKKMLSQIGVETIEVENLSCCPEPIYLRAYGKEATLALSARNLSLVEKEGDKMLIVCNGCYLVLHDAQNELKDLNLREKINSMLSDSKYLGNVKTVHILELLNSDITAIKSAVKNPLSGLKVAVHYGCHCLYPPAVSTDNPENPSSLDTIVEATGAESVDYEGKIDCCGAPLIAFDVREADEILLNKLVKLKGKVDCIVTACPGCFLRFDAILDEKKEYAVPVIHLSELLCLAFGISGEELFFEGHITNVSPVLQKIGFKENSEMELVKKYFDVNALERHCGACSKECTASIRTRNSSNPFNPIEVVEKLRAGKFYDVVRGHEIWCCLQCGKCELRCPNNTGLKEMFAQLRGIAVSHGESPKIINEKRKMLENTGYAVPIKKHMRKKMGIGDAPKVDASEIKKIMSKIEGN